MSILTLTNPNEQDKLTRRVQFNQDLAAMQMEKFLVGNGISLEQDGALTVAGDGSITFSNHTNSDGNEVMNGYLADGTITGVNADAVSIEHMGSIRPQVIPGHINCGKLHVSTSQSISDMDINIHEFEGGGRYRQSPGVSFQYSYKDFSIHNTSITFNNSSDRTIRFLNGCTEGVTGFDFSGLRTNAERLYIHVFDFSEELMQLFDRTTCQIKDTKLKAICPTEIKTIKKAVAVVNNPKRYSLLSDVLTLKKDIRLTDIIKVGHMDGLKEVMFANNNVQLIFRKDDGTAQPYNLHRIPQGTHNPKDLGTMYQRTADGWWVIWVKN